MNVAYLGRTSDRSQWSAGTGGFSGYSETISKSLEKVWNQWLEATVLGGQLRVTFEKLDDIMASCSQEDWDGDGANRITNDVYREAMRFIQLFPPTIPIQHLSPEPSGGIAFEWRKDQKHAFVVELSGKGSITYAGLNGVDNRVRGTAYFGDSLPNLLIENIKLTIGI